MMNSMNPIMSFAEHAFHRIDGLPVVETFVILVLAIITVFRRELSSNRNYKSKDQLQKYKKDTKNPTTIYEEQKSHICNFYQQNKIGNRKLGFPLDGDCLLSTIEYLNRSDLGALSCVSKEISSRMSQSFLWEQLWMQRYYALWSSEAIQKIRTYRGGSCLWEPPAQINDTKKLHNQHLAFYKTPSQGWKRFLLEFDICWMDWLLAGCSKRQLCIIGFEGRVYDVTNLIDIHPGSAETLLDNGGGDCTSTFYDVGHSSEANALRESFLIATPTSPALLPRSLLEVTMLKDSQDVIQSYGYESQSIEAVSTVTLCVLPEALESSNTTSRSRDYSDCVKINTTGNGGSHSSTSSHTCHLGRRRSFYDPISQQWNVWYTCCSQGIPITEDIKKSKPISYSKKLFNSLKLS